MGGITKSLWELFIAANRIAAPAPDDVIALAPQPGTPFVTQLDGITASDFAAYVQTLLPAPVVVRFQTVLDDAALKAAADTQIEITEGGIAPPNVRFPLFVAIQVETSNGNYTNLDAAGAFQVTWADSGSVASLPVDVGLTLLNQSAKTYLVVPLGPSAPQTITSRPKLKISNNGSGAFTGGGAGNFLKVETWYSIAPLRA